MPESADPLITEVRELVWALSQNELDAAGVARLEALLLDNLAARREYLRYTRLLSDLQLSAQPDRLRPAAPPGAPILGFLGSSLDWLSGGTISPRMLVVAIAVVLSSYFAGLLILVGIQRAWVGVPLGDPLAEHHAAAPVNPELTDKSGIARLSEVAGCVWPATRPEESIAVGQVVELTAGVAEVRYGSGVSVAVEGPCSLGFESAGRLRLDRGKLLARVPRGAEGFTVGAPAADIIDLGTEFSVEVEESGATSVHTLRGKVAVQPTAAAAEGAPASSVRVTAGQAVRVASNDGQVQPIPFVGQKMEIVNGRLRATLDTQSSPNAASTATSNPPRQTPSGPVGRIPLGSLFDDPHGTPLAAAIATSTERATPEVGDLGIDRALYGGDASKVIAGKVAFDFANLGWSNSAIGNTGSAGAIRNREDFTGRPQARSTAEFGRTAYPVSDTDLLQTRMAPAGTAVVGNFLREVDGNEGTGEPALHNGSFGRPGNANDGTGQAPAGMGEQVTYTLDTREQATGYDITQVNTYSGWSYGRFGQAYELSFHAVGMPPEVFSSPIVVTYHPDAPSKDNFSSAVRISGAGPDGKLARGVDQVRFAFRDIANDATAGYQGYRELDVIGDPAARPATVTAGEAAAEGIGMQANCLVTFDLNEIRAAGGLGGRPLQFVADHTVLGPQHLLAIASDGAAVLAASLDGQTVTAAAHAGGVWAVTGAISRPPNEAGRKVAFRLPLPEQARYLTLVVVGAGPVATHAVWSGARLEPKSP